MKKDLVLQSVQSSVSSIFSKEDVINLINSIDESSSRKITTHDILMAIDQVIDSFERNTEEIVDYTSVEFNISYGNRLEVESVGLNLDYVREALENTFMDFGEAIEEDDLVELERANDEERDDE